MQNKQNYIRTDTPIITIITAVYNGKDKIQECIESIKNQTYQNREHIIIDGGSTDGTVDLLKENSPHLTHWSSEPDNGIGDAWNKALTHAKGEWIIFLGSDDKLHDCTVLEDIAKALNTQEEFDILYGQVTFSDGLYQGKTFGSAKNSMQLSRTMSIPHTASFFKSTLLAELGDFDTNFKIACDYELLLRKPTIKAKFIQRRITLMGGGGISTKQRKESILESYLAKKKNNTSSPLVRSLWYMYYHARYILDTIKFRK